MGSMRLASGVRMWAVWLGLVLVWAGSATVQTVPEPDDVSRIAEAEKQAPVQTAPDRERRVLRVPSKVRVGLLTDLESVQLPCCDSDVVAVVGTNKLASVHEIVVTPGVEQLGSSVYLLQVAALRDEYQAAQLAQRVEGLIGVPTSIVFDARSGFYRVRAGRYATRQEAESARTVFNQRNLHDVWVTSEQKALKNPAIKVRQADRAWLVHSRWLRIRSESDAGLTYGDQRYRGDLLVFLNDRGTLNLINEVTLDDYLRGVVPREMGPAIFDDISALKAQAVAARTYTLRNLGEFGGEGFDICATPRCQVYGGMSSEHELSDRAVLETSGEVLLYEGDFADTLYSSTCGGHTENVETVFPLKSGSYLRGVPCLEAGVDKLGRGSGRGLEMAVGLAELVVPPVIGADPAGDFARRVRALTGRAGYAREPSRLESFDRREVQNFLASELDLELDASLFVAREDLPYLLEAPPEGWTEEDLKLAAYLARAGMLSGPLDRPIARETIEHTLFHLALFLRVLEPTEVRYLESNGAQLAVRDGAEVHQLDLAETMLTFRRWGERTEEAQLALLPGDRVTAFQLDGKVVGLRHQVDRDGVAYDRTSNMSSWTRFRSDTELARRVGERYPGLDFKTFEVIDRGVSGRVSRVRIEGHDGQEVEIKGLPIRWTFDLPDTLFTARRLNPKSGRTGWLFSGRGWGHGVGMCQVGSYGMAVRGHNYREILNHYYRGVRLVRMQPKLAAAG